MSVIADLTGTVEPTIQQNGVTLRWTLNEEFVSQSVYYTNHYVSSDSNGQEGQSENTDSENKMLDIDPAAESVTLFDLTQDRTYSFTIIGVKKSDAQTSSQQISVYINPAKIVDIGDMTLFLQGTNKSLSLEINYVNDAVGYSYADVSMQEYQIMVNGKFDGDSVKNTRVVTVAAGPNAFKEVNLSDALNIQFVNDTYYEVSIRARNYIGWTGMSSTKVEVPSSTANPPVSLEVFGGVSMNSVLRSPDTQVDPTDETLLVVWTKAAQIENAPDTKYVLTVRDQTTQIYTVDIVPADLTDVSNSTGIHYSTLLTSSELALVDGTEYTVEVVAYNSFGESSVASANGIPSGQIEVITGVVTRTGVNIVSAGHVGQNSSEKIEVSFTVPDTNGADITSYDFMFNGTSVNLTSAVLSVTSGASVTRVFDAADLELSNGTEYTVTVAMNTNNGSVNASQSVTATPSTLPSQVQNMVVAPNRNAQSSLGSTEIQVDWSLQTIVSDTGGSAVTKYEIDGAGQMYTVMGNATASKLIAGLTVGGVYDMKVRSVNANGNGPWSVSAEAQPSAQPQVTGGIQITESFDQIVLDLQNIAITSGGYDTSSVEVSVRDPATNALVGAAQYVQVPTSLEVIFDLSSYLTANPAVSVFNVEVIPFNAVYGVQDSVVHTIEVNVQSNKATIQNLRHTSLPRNMDETLQFNWDQLSASYDATTTVATSIDVWVATAASTDVTSNTSYGAPSAYKFVETISSDAVQYILTGRTPIIVYDDNVLTNPSQFSVINGANTSIKLVTRSESNQDNSASIHTTESSASGVSMGAPIVSNVSYDHATNSLSFTVNADGSLLTELIAFHEMGSGDAIDLLVEASNNGALTGQYTGDMQVTHTDVLMNSNGVTSKTVTIVANSQDGLTYAITPSP